MPRPPAIASDHLRRLAISTLGEPPYPRDPTERAGWAERFTDEFGARPRCVPPLLARISGVRPSPPARMRSLDELLWWHAVLGEADEAPDLTGEEGPFVSEDGSTSIEVRTECELSALHALSVIAVSSNEPRLWLRVRSAAEWLVRELQPDNATGRPWGVHVFARLALSEHDTDHLASAASLYAQTLVHNCMVSQGRPDRISACILLDAANTLDLIESTRPGWL